MRRRLIILGSIIVVALGVLFWQCPQIPRSCSAVVDQISATVTYPFLYVQSTLVEPIKSWAHERKTNQQLRDELGQLRAERDRFYADTVELRGTLAHSADIKELSAFKKRYAHNDARIVRIIARLLSDDEHYMLIDAGSSAGMALDMVVVHNNALVGRVCELYPWYSKVRLITDSSCKVAARCASSKVTGVHRGCNREQKSCLSYVSHLAHVKEGDLLLSSGEGLIFPEGFSLGSVVRTEPSDLYHEIVVRPACDVRTMTHCMVLAKKDLTT